MPRRNAQRPVLVTTAPPTPASQRRRREKQYMVMMAIRMACFLLILVVPGFWKIVMVAGAVILPGVAVILANAVDRRRSQSATGRVYSDANALSAGIVIHPEHEATAPESEANRDR